MKKKYTLLLALMFTGLGFGQVFITEIADPNNNNGAARFVELYNAGGTSVDLSNWGLRRWTNGNTSSQSDESLSGEIPAGGFIIFAKHSTNFSSTFTSYIGTVINLGSGGPADSNGDDQIALIDNTNSIVDIFGVPGQDGSGTCHEFEDGRVERIATITSGNPIWDESEWNVWADNTTNGCTNHTRDPQNAPGDFDPGVWIGAGASGCTSPETQASAYNTTFIGTTTATLNWTSGDGDNVLVLVKEGSAVDTDPASGTPYTGNTVFTSGDQIGTGNYVVQSGSATSSVSITGLSLGTVYHVAVYEYNTTDICYELTELIGDFTTDCGSPTDVTAFTTTEGDSEVDLTWTNGSCFNEVLVVAKEASAVSVTPTGDGTAYTANATFGSGTDLVESEFVVYKGTGTFVTIDGLTNGTTYHFTVFTRKDMTWSTGVSDSETPVLSWCDPNPSSVDGFGITNVTVGTIDNTTVAESGNYGDYSVQSTDLEQGETANLDITYETGWTYTTRIWIDYNNDGDFTDTDEEVYAGESLAASPTTLNTSFTIPLSIALGSYRLRIGGADQSTPTPCYTGSYASFEDYTINVIPANTDTKVQFVTTSASVSEGVGTYDLVFSILNESATADTTFDVALTGGDGDDADINTYATQTVTFAGGTNTNQTVTLTVTDDAIFETNEVLRFTIETVAGGTNAGLGSNVTFDLTITNNDASLPIALPYSEDFSHCSTAEWTAYDQAGDDEWNCSGGEFVINGFTGSDDLDWLISDFTIDFEAYGLVNIDIITQEKFGNTINEAGEFELRYSTDYAGAGDPTLFTWTTLSFNPNNSSTSSSLSSASTTAVDASSIPGIAYLAFFYDMTAGSDAEEWRILDISITEINDADSEANDSGSQPTATTISSLVDTDIEAIEVFDMDLYDFGTTDDTNTEVTNIRITPYTTNTADWTDNIQGVTISDGSIIPISGVTIDDAFIDINFTSGDLTIPDTDITSITISVYLNSSNITDGEVLSFAVDADNNGFEADVTGSTFSSNLTGGDFNSNDFTIDVDVTQLVFTQQPPALVERNIAMSDVVVQAQDGNGNIDVNYDFDINITSTGTLTVSPVIETAVSGIATFSTIIHSGAGTSLVLIADDTLFPNADSSSFDVVILPTTLAFQSFGSDGGDWDYTTDPATYNVGGDTWDVVNASFRAFSSIPSEGTQFFGIRDLTNTNGGVPTSSTNNDIIFESISITNYENVKVSFDFETEAFDSTDRIRYELFEDGVSASEVEFVGSGSNDGTVTIPVTAGVEEISLILHARQNGGDDYAGLDNFKVIGSLPSETYNGNASVGFGGPLGNGNFEINAFNPVADFKFNRGTGDFNDYVVIYIDSEAGGIASTVDINDENDDFRKAVSGRNGGDKSTVNFPPGFNAEYAVAMRFDKAELFSIDGSGNLTSIRTLYMDITLTNAETSYSFTIDLVNELNTTPGFESFKFLGTYLNGGNAYRSNESIGRANYADSDGSGNPGHALTTIETYYQVTSRKQGGQAPSLADGLWTNDSAWINGNAPFDTDIISLNNDVILNTDLSVNGLALGTTTFTVLNGNKLTTSGQITGSGLFDIQGKLSITDGGSTSITPTYSSGSTLEYKDITTTYNRFSEWNTGATVGAGVPDNVIIENATLDLTNGAQSDFVDFTVVSDLSIRTNGSLTIDATESLSLGGDLSNAGGSLDLNSESDDYSSLIVEGTSTGDVIYRRHVNSLASTVTGDNDLISAPVTNTSQTFGVFRGTNGNIPSGTVGGGPTTFYLFGPFDNTNPTHPYTLYSDANDGDVITAGVGYRAASTDTSTFTFVGDVETGTVPVGISVGSAFQWNLIGNPYPSYINSEAFLTENAAFLDDNAVGIYGYHGLANENGGWTIINLNTMNEAENIAPGQGFLVAAAGTSTLNFTPTMRQVSGADDFILGRTTDNKLISLKIESNDASYHTDFYFNDNSTRALDPGYDAAIFDANLASLYIYSHLVENNEGRSMAIQSLNSSDLTAITIPLGVGASQGNQITFSIDRSTLPNTVDVYLQDNVTNTFTLLTNSDYAFTPDTDISGTGRFFLGFADTALSAVDNTFDALSIYTNDTDKTIVIAGQLLEPTTGNVYDLQGRLVASAQLETSKTSQSIAVSNLSNGVYLVHLKSATQRKSLKVIIR